MSSCLERRTKKQVKVEGWDSLGTPVSLTPEEISKYAAADFIKEDDAQIGYICRDCAIALGGEFEDGHVASCHINKCSVCFQKKSVCSPNDWQLNRLGQKIKITHEEWD